MADKTGASSSLNFGTATPELPVPILEEAQRYFCNQLGFSIAWTNEEGRISGVNRGECALFLRESEEIKSGRAYWIFTDTLDVAYEDLARRGANMIVKPADTPWGLRQFSVQDPWGNTFHFFCD
ncbi:MAG: VOC family protein [Pseudomonadota bacterium]